MSDTSISKEELPWYYQKKHVPWLVMLWLLFEKMIAHVYLVSLTYAGLPMSWSYGFSGLLGMIGIIVVWRGLKITDNEVRATWHGYLGGAIIWTAIMEMYLHWQGKVNIQGIGIDGGEGVFIPAFDMMQGPPGGVFPYFMGEHVLLYASGLFCVMTFFFMMMNKDVRCRMLLWIKKKLGLKVGTPTRGYMPQYARVAAAEVFYVNWFMYVLILVLLDERVFGLHSTVNYIGSALVFFWAFYVLYMLMKQRETGLTIRYGIGAVGVFWFVPEMATLWQWFKEPWVNFYQGTFEANMNGIMMIFIIIAYICLTIMFFKTPVNPKTGKSL